MININQLQAIISAYNLTVTDRKDGNQELRGIMDGKKVLVTVWYTTNTVTFMDYSDYSSVTKKLV